MMLDYGITIIARGEDILSSTPKHILIMQALNSDLPDFCHLPLLFGPDGKKLSKRLQGQMRKLDINFLPEWFSAELFSEIIR